MRKIYNYLLAIAFCASVTSCLEEFGSDRPTAIGEEVQFGLSLETPETKTVYGPESGNAFPIYWSEGDKVLVASPQCGKGRNNAEYQVTPVANQSYAKAMTRLGDYGVQWGSSAADFYSIYPSTGATWLDLETENVTAKLNISPQQSANLLLDGNKVYNAADMDNIIMYARTGNVGNGNTVNLNYKPYSTVLEFEMGVSKLANGSYGTATVESMTLTAPEGVAIAGDFTLQFNGNEAPIISASGNNTNRISMVFTTKPILNSENKVCKAKFAVLPIDGIIIGTEKDPWTVSIDVIEGSENQKKTYTKKLKIEAELAPGMIHKITLPKFAPADEWKPSGDSWISSMYEYESIYLTELSIPGAWYAGAPTKDGYQATNQISTLWGAGVRAFAVETRTAVQDIASAFGIGDPETPVSVVVSGTGPNSTGSHPSGLNSLNAGTLSAEEGYKNEAYSYAITDITADDATKILRQKSQILNLLY